MARVPAGIMAVLGAMGVAVGVVMVGIGLVWAIPTLGLPGVIWTGFAAVITAANARRLLAKR